MKPTIKGEPVISLARAKKLGLSIKTNLLLSSEVMQKFSWERVTAQPASSSFCRSRLLVSFWGRDKGVAIKSLSDGFKDIFGMLARGGDIPANATESLGPLKRAKPT